MRQYLELMERALAELVKNEVARWTPILQASGIVAN